MTDDFTPPGRDNRMLGVALSLIAAAFMLYAAFSHRWLANGNKHLEYGFGLRSNFECAKTDNAQQCEWHSNKEAVAEFKQLEELDPAHQRLSSPAFIPASWVTLVSILLSALGLLAAAGMAATKTAKQLPIFPTTVALLGGMVALIAGCVFVATKPGPPGMVGAGVSFWLFGAGVVVGIVGAQMLAKVIRPPDVEWTA